MKRDWKKLVLSIALSGATTLYGEGLQAAGPRNGGGQFAQAGRQDGGPRPIQLQSLNRQTTPQTGKSFSPKFSPQSQPPVMNSQPSLKPIGNFGQGVGGLGNGGQGKVSPIKPKLPNLPLNPDGIVKPKLPNLPLDPDGIVKPKLPNLPLDPGGIVKPKLPSLPLDPDGIVKPKLPILPLDPDGIVKPKPPVNAKCLPGPCWKFPMIWWYPRPNFCHHHCTIVYPINVITVVETITVIDATVPTQIDLMLQNVAFLDAGDAASNLGPRYRVTVKNNSSTVVGPFNVLLMAGVDATPRPDQPTTVAKIERMESGQVIGFDMRLPVASLTMAQDAAGQPAPFRTLFVAVDSHEQTPDADRSNNGAVLNRSEIPTMPF